jgi:hypothetical protein
MSQEIKLLDHLGGGSQPYVQMEHFVFDGDRLRALGSIEKMQMDGLIVLAIGGQQVEGWRLAAWRRTPDDPDTASSLEQSELSITDLGVKWLTHGP